MSKELCHCVYLTRKVRGSNYKRGVICIKISSSVLSFHLKVASLQLHVHVDF